MKIFKLYRIFNFRYESIGCYNFRQGGVYTSASCTGLILADKTFSRITIIHNYPKGILSILKRDKESNKFRINDCDYDENARTKFIDKYENRKFKSIDYGGKYL